jgi:hypothetical protein
MIVLFKKNAKIRKITLVLKNFLENLPTGGISHPLDISSNDLIRICQNSGNGFRNHSQSKYHSHTLFIGKMSFQKLINCKLNHGVQNQEQRLRQPYKFIKILINYLL